MKPLLRTGPAQAHGLHSRRTQGLMMRHEQRGHRRRAGRPARRGACASSRPPARLRRTRLLMGPLAERSGGIARARSAATTRDVVEESHVAVAATESRAAAADVGARRRGPPRSSFGLALRAARLRGLHPRSASRSSSTGPEVVQPARPAREAPTGAPPRCSASLPGLTRRRARPAPCWRLTGELHVVALQPGAGVPQRRRDLTVAGGGMARAFRQGCALTFAGRDRRNRATRG
jgi:hypothetical protein